MLYGRSGNVDPYKTAVIDTMVAEVQSTPGEDRCVLLLVSDFRWPRLNIRDSETAGL
jgi:hypothetical protein